VTAPLGLFAGGGQLAGTLLAALKEQGREVVVVGFKGETPEEVLRGASRSLSVDTTDLSPVIAFLKEAGVREAFMAGTVSHLNIYRPPAPESLTARVLAALADRRADTLLKAAAFQLARAGIRLVSAMPHLKALVPARGALTRRAPTAEEARDVAFGLRIARGLAGLDVGQTVVVKDRAVVAVEALEGTDAAIRRAGELCGPGAVVVKVAKPRQDFRFDVPVVGPGTVASLRAARAAALAVEAGRTLILSRPEVVALADAAGIALTAV